MRSGSTRWFARVNAVVVDALIAVALAGASCIAGNQYTPAGWPRFDAPAYILTCLVSLPLAARRRFPVLVLLATNATFVAYVVAGYQPSLNWWSPMLALFFVAASRTSDTVLVCWAVNGSAMLYSGIAAGLPLLLSAAQTLLIPPTAVAVGVTNRRLAERNALLAALTSRLHAEQRERARQAVVEERVRIARELHDIIAHHMSVISIQAGLAKYVLTSDPSTANSALATVADTSREALAEMRRMLTLLRVDPADFDDTAGTEPQDARAVNDPAPGLDRLDALVDRVRTAGLPVEVVVTGERRPLAPGVDLCVYRVIQEGLTNILTHAGPARATVALIYRDDGVVVRITDNGRRPPARTNLPRPGRGHGLSGMRERARVYGGSLSAGHRKEGGFEVVLTLPFEGLGQARAADDTALPLSVPYRAG
ncbi:sensor histidine kinase [Dactylosporangium roseum]|uniref:histidine kinase n=1 Tax=Dactylosporangium roseum TaxID=47989 RepID=A0ABY5YXI8_9ACTN|nr:sensor histidine kinase [Dactylosporangium roseum]UWZ34466.1 sensor histidine kinase [Dactylosporangium roseum]